MTQIQQSEPIVYQGQFGEFTITQSDRTGVIIYRAGLMVAALSFALGIWLLLSQSATPTILNALTLLYACFCVALGVSLATIHIYMVQLHRGLQIFWAVGVLASVVLAVQSGEPLALTVYHHPLTILGIGFTFAALTGIYFKEAFCFNRLETKVLTPLVPLLLLGHLFGFLPMEMKPILLLIWAIFFLVFAVRKTMQAIPADIGDKSVFEYLKQKRSVQA
ncbi:DUF2301 domain-containing membrane protein [Aerosakkonema sp. BLCC-F183]|uniref:DUF2301 domain-containing membrane protein n=1 Tax=Aerosakkonema sp. BLCC-F183 TaxID=3342834 RepID=UPI0035BABF02